jgi:hypothetical protein
MANPQDEAPQPPFPEQLQEWPGVESEMEPKPDFGENSYRGCDRLKGKAAEKSHRARAANRTTRDRGPWRYQQ